MISINLPETGSTRVELVEEPRKEKSGDAPFEPVSWIDLKEPTWTTLNKESAVDDKELALFLSANDVRFRYDYVRLGCSFKANPPERFEKAWLKVTLNSQDSRSGDEPISWSIAPVNDYDLSEE